MTKVSRYAALLLTSLVVQAADSDVFTLGRVEIVAKQQPVNTAMEEVVDNEIVVKHNLKNMVEAAQLVPGVTLDHTGNRNEFNVMVRGFDSKQVPLFIDGIPVYIPYDGNVDLARFTTADISELRVAKGFSSVLYGANTLGGAINIVSKRPVKSWEGTLAAEFITGESSDTSGYETSFNIGTNQGNWYMQMGGSYFDRDAFSISDNFAFNEIQPDKTRENAEQKDQKISFKMGFTPNETDEYVIGFSDQRAEKETPLYAGTDEDEYPRYWTWPNYDKQSIYFFSNTAVGKGYVKSRVYYDTFDNSLYAYKNETFSSTRFQSIYEDYTYGATVEVGYPIVEKNMLRMALTFKDDVHEENDLGEPQSTYEDRTISLGIEDTYEFSDQISVVAGISYDQRESVEATEYDEDTGFTSLPTETTHALNPQIGLFHSYKNGDQVRATVSRKTRFANIKDRYSSKLGYTLPNPDLKAEKATHYEIGYTTLLNDKVRLDTAIFQSDIDDAMEYIEVEDSDGSLIEQKVNIAEVQNRGVELAVAAMMSDTLELGGSYSYLRRKNKSAVEVEIAASPKHKIYTYANWDFAPQWELIASARYESSRISRVHKRGAILESDSFTVANVKVGYKVMKDLNIELGARNITDEDYEYDEGYPQPGRTWFTSVRYSF